MGSSSRKLWGKVKPPRPKPHRGPPLKKAPPPEPEIPTPAPEPPPVVLPPASVQIGGELHLSRPQLTATVQRKSFRRWPNLLVATTNKVYLVKEKKVVKTLLDNPDNDDKQYLGISWSNADLVVAGETAFIKFYRKLEKKYRRPSPLKVNKIHCIGAVIFAFTDDAVAEYTIGLELNRRQTKLSPPVTKPLEEGPQCFVGSEGSKVLLFDENMDNIDELDLSEPVNEVRIIDPGYCHNNIDFPIQELL